MATRSYAHSFMSVAKRLKLSPPNPTIPCATRDFHRSARQYADETVPTLRNDSQTGARGPAIAPKSPLPPVESLSPEAAEKELQRLRLPRAVQATYLTPLRRKATHHIPACDLQLRSYSVRNLEVFADFAMRAAYYLNLPAKGPVPLPRITERWTVPRSNFVHKKSQENFERITLRRLIQIQDGHPETVAVWLGFLQKHHYYGIGMKANVFEHGGLSVAEEMDAEAERVGPSVRQQLELTGGRPGLIDQERLVEDMVHREPFKGAWGAYAPMAGAQSVPHANLRVDQHVVK